MGRRLLPSGGSEDLGHAKLDHCSDTLLGRQLAGILQRHDVRHLHGHQKGKGMFWVCFAQTLQLLPAGDSSADIDDTIAFGNNTAAWELPAQCPKAGNQQPTHCSCQTVLSP